MLRLSRRCWFSVSKFVLKFCHRKQGQSFWLTIKSCQVYNKAAQKSLRARLNIHNWKAQPVNKHLGVFFSNVSALTYLKVNAFHFKRLQKEFCV